MQRLEVMKYKYFVIVLQQIFQVSVLYSSLYISDNFWLFLPRSNTNIWTFSSSHFPNRLVTLAWMFLSFWLSSGRFANPKCRYSTFWEWDSTISSFSGVFRNSSDKSYWFILQVSWSLHYINMMLGSVSFAQRCLSEGNFLLWYFEYISQPVLYHFKLKKEVESVLLLLLES